MKEDARTRNKLAPKPNQGKPTTPDYSANVAVGALLAVILLSGCASPSVGGGADLYHYNGNTGYPAVGSSLSNL